MFIVFSISPSILVDSSVLLKIFKNSFYHVEFLYFCLVIDFGLAGRYATIVIKESMLNAKSGIDILGWKRFPG